MNEEEQKLLKPKLIKTDFISTIVKHITSSHWENFIRNGITSVSHIPKG